MFVWIYRRFCFLAENLKHLPHLFAPAEEICSGVLKWIKAIKWDSIPAPDTTHLLTQHFLSSLSTKVAAPAIIFRATCQEAFFLGLKTKTSDFLHDLLRLCKRANWGETGRNGNYVSSQICFRAPMRCVWEDDQCLHVIAVKIKDKKRTGTTKRT